MTIKSFEGIAPNIDAQAYVDETALVLGDVHIGKDSSIWPFTAVRGDVNKIRIGRGTNIQDNSVLHVTHEGPYNEDGYDLIIGDYITAGHRVILHGCRVEDYCLIGMGATVMDGAVIHSHTLLGAGSLVTPGKILEGGYLWHGSPAKKVRALTEAEIASIEYSAQHYIDLKNRHS